MFRNVNSGSLACLIGGILLAVAGCTPAGHDTNLTVERVMDSLVTRIYAQLDTSQLDELDEPAIMALLSSPERRALAENYWQFKVGVPVVVSVMRDTAQRIVPFWLMEQGFKKTSHRVRNELYVYEVWQKDFPAGTVALGINGFDKHRPVYFVGVAPLHAGETVQIIPIFPAEQTVALLDTGAFTYHDWDELVLTEVPTDVRGQQLIQTIRGRAREAHVLDAFRKTAFPSSDRPDQVTLTLPEQSDRGMIVQWRCAPTVQKGWVAYWLPGTSDTVRVEVDRTVQEDRLLRNDRYVSRFHLQLDRLLPGTTYQYRVGHGDVATETASFTTAGTDNRFSFIWYGDIHNDRQWGDLAVRAAADHPESAFHLSVGDLVNTGLHRDDWDALLGYSSGIFGEKPFMAVPGNHDSQDGLGAGMYREMLSYPGNGPAGQPPGLTYAFRYEHALFLMIDVVSFPVAQQTDWIAAQLANTDALWKFVVFHFPPFTLEEPYPDIVSEWVPLFDRYGVDMVMNGHFHYYLRTQPMVAGNPADRGTTYLMSVGTRGKNEDSPPEPYAANVFKDGYLYQHVQLDGRKLSFECRDAAGNVRDRFEITK